ncbi:S-adenosyl-l-methionine hydroxide adenosyltransferase family protein [Psychroflexus sp. ALD_RP9]|uniref:SAM hydrolase/SAM-dependent halogenase family protein n=1 Tax=Psychroflexus sp. ALD_RP9 TaxID=2777186 RepID=UPI001A8F2E26|nr:SAM-dependent chlorinase/fluorinase [Psychroflexus sp. ALD_RP9]QSS96548.1 SAM-dependent chlorinase/fluorinase [Psychroflexus sp. ALD_RP9]
MPLVTLTTDFGLKDHSVAAVKGALYSELQDVKIIDITHLISPFHIIEAAYVIKNAYHNFPKGSIHIVGVDSELTPENKHIVMALDGHFFIAANNGILSLIASEINPDEIVEINIHDRVDTNFTVLDIFIKVAAHIARGGNLSVIGKKLNEIKQIKHIEPSINNENNQMIGHVIYIDNFGNVVTNIKRQSFQQIAKGRSFTITARSQRFKKIYDSYSEAINFSLPKDQREEDGKKLALFNSSSYLELAIYKSNPSTVGGASSLFGLKALDTITINFDE